MTTFSEARAQTMSALEALGQHERESLASLHEPTDGRDQQQSRSARLAEEMAATTAHIAGRQERWSYLADVASDPAPSPEAYNRTATTIMAGEQDDHSTSARLVAMHDLVADAVANGSRARQTSAHIALLALKHADTLDEALSTIDKVAALRDRRGVEHLLPGLAKGMLRDAWSAGGRGALQAVGSSALKRMESQGRG